MKNSELYIGFKFAKPVSIKKVTKTINSIGKKTKERLVLYGSETILHDKVWNECPHVCEICGGPIMERYTWCFAHRLSKGQYKQYRYMPENIALVCSIKCHEKIDRLYQGERRIYSANILDEILAKKN